MYGQTEGWTDRPYFTGPSWLRPGVQKMVLKIPILILFHFYLLCWFSPAFCLYCSCKLFWLYRPLQVALACFRWLKHILGCFSSFLTLVSTTKTAPQKLWNFSRRDIISDYEFLLSVLMLLLLTLKSITKSVTNVYGAKDL